MWRYWGVLGLVCILAGCAGSTYPGYYSTYPYGGESYYYDEFYGPPLAYPYPDYYYYQAVPSPVPTPFPVPAPRGHFEREHGSFERGPAYPVYERGERSGHH